jgi:hypothetical protein
LVFNYNSNEPLKQIHYILDKEEFVLTNERRLILKTNGIHYLSCWAIDKFGNEGLPGSFDPIKIDINEPPTFQIETPDNGLYIFGRKIPAQINKSIIVGDFDMIVNASDETSGVYVVQLYGNNELIDEDPKEPYIINICIRHLGKMELKVVVQDVTGNTAEETMEVYYYNLI